MTDQSNQLVPPPLPNNPLGAGNGSQFAADDTTPKRAGWLRRWVWAPVGRNENWAQTVFRVLGNLLRIAFTVLVLFAAVIASIFGYFFAKENRPELFGAEYLTEWCDGQYDNHYYKHERSDKVCAVRWKEYETFLAACNVAEQRSRKLLYTECELPGRPSFRELSLMLSAGKTAFGNDPVAAANLKVTQLKSSLAYQLSNANFECAYVRSQFDKRACQLATDKVSQTESELTEFEQLISKAEAEAEAYDQAELVCSRARIARSHEVRDQVVAMIEEADHLNIDLNTEKCATRAKEWAPSIYKY